MPRRFVIFLFLLLIPGIAKGQRAAVMAFPPQTGGGAAAGEVPQWELISFPTPPGALRLTAQDARGGPRISVPAQQPSTAIPLPLIAPAMLPGHLWPIDITIESDSGDIQHQRIEATLPSNAVPSFRVFVPENTSIAPAQWTLITDLPISTCIISRDQLLNAPMLTFTAANAVLLTPDLAGELSDSRATALINAGIQLVSISEKPPSNPGLSPLIWDHPSRNPTAQGVWLTPAAPIAKPSVLEPGLANLPAFFAEAQTPARARTLLLALPLAGIALLLLARGIFRRTLPTLLAATVVLALLPFGVIAALKALNPSAPLTLTGAWRVTFSPAPPDATLNNPAAFELDESLSTHTTLFAESFQTTAPADTLLFPVAPRPRDYFSLDHATLSLGSGSTPSTLSIDLQSRRVIAYETRHLHPAGILPPIPLTADDATRFTTATHQDLDGTFLLESGYLTPVAAAATQPGAPPRQLFTQWLQNRPEALSARAWYQLRFRADSRYLCIPSSSRELNLFDFGPAQPR